MSGTLYLVGTPVGNLEDVTLRALSVLKQVAVIACEDTRRTRVLLARHGVATPTVSLPAFAERQRAAGLVARLVAGEDVALVTDAGMPGISDPGSELTRQAVAVGIRVVPIPGASAPLLALAASGLPVDRFTFFGFLPRKGGARRDALEALRRAPGALVLFESPRRLGETLRELQEALGDRRACVARELTKLHEELARGTLSELAERFSGEVLGELTLVVEGSEAGAAEEPPDPDEALRTLLAAGSSVKDAAHEVAEALALPRREVYQRALAIAAEGEGEEPA